MATQKVIIYNVLTYEGRSWSNVIWKRDFAWNATINMMVLFLMHRHTIIDSEKDIIVKWSSMKSMILFQ